VFITSEFLFIHIPKTGGIFVTRVLERHFEPVVEMPHHVPLERAPERYKGLPALAFVRNPWDWYVSYYEFARRPWVTKVALAAEAREGFAPFLHSAAAHVVPRTGKPGLASNYLSWAADATFVGRFENLRTDLMEFLRQSSATHSAALENDVLHDPVRNRSWREADYRVYYDEELRRLVGSECSDVIAKFGYDF
jgi:hypothetical protein